MSKNPSAVEYSVEDDCPLSSILVTLLSIASSHRSFSKLPVRYVNDPETT